MARYYIEGQDINQISPKPGQTVFDKPVEGKGFSFDSVFIGIHVSTFMLDCVIALDNRECSISERMRLLKR